MELLATDIVNDPKLLVTEPGDSKKAYQIGGGFKVLIDYHTRPIFTIQPSPWSAYKPSGQSSVYYQNTFTAKTQDFFDKSAANGGIYNTVDYKFSGWNLSYETWDSENDYYITSYVPIGSNTSLSTIANYSVDHYNGGPGSAVKGYEVYAGYTWCWSSRMTISGEGKIEYQQNYYNGVNNFCGITAIPSAGWKFDHYERRKINAISSIYTAYDYSAYSMNTNLDEVYTVYFAEDDPYNPLNLPANTVRVRTSDGNVPVKGTYATYQTATLVEGTSDVYDVYKSGTSFEYLLYGSNNITEVLGANTKGIINMKYMFDSCNALTTVALFDTRSVTDMRYMFYKCSALTSVPLFDTSSLVVMDYMFADCLNVESGALALYNQASTQTTPPDSHTYTFGNCGSNTVTGAAELAQIPSDWK